MSISYCSTAIDFLFPYGDISHSQKIQFLNKCQMLDSKKTRHIIQSNSKVTSDYRRREYFG
jgi:hypothetical protein